MEYLRKTQKLVSAYFENKDRLSFGRLTNREWNNMRCKHLDHHLQQLVLKNIRTY